MEPVAYDECFVPMSPSAASTVADDVGPEGSLGSRRSELPNEDTDGDAPTECPKAGGERLTLEPDASDMQKGPLPWTKPVTILHTSQRKS